MHPAWPLVLSLFLCARRACPPCPPCLPACTPPCPLPPVKPPPPPPSCPCRRAVSHRATTRAPPHHRSSMLGLLAAVLPPYHVPHPGCTWRPRLPPCLSGEGAGSCPAGSGMHLAEQRNHKHGTAQRLFPASTTLRSQSNISHGMPPHSPRSAPAPPLRRAHAGAPTLSTRPASGSKASSQQLPCWLQRPPA